MKTKTFVVGLFLALCLAISLPAIHQVANTSALQGGYVGPAPASESEYYEVGADCVLYHAYWDGTATDHSPAGNDGVVTGATFVANGVYFDQADDDIITTIQAGTTNIGTNDYAMFAWINIDDTTGDNGVFVGFADSDSSDFGFFYYNKAQGKMRGASYEAGAAILSTGWEAAAAVSRGTWLFLGYECNRDAGAYLSKNGDVVTGPLGTTDTDVMDDFKYISTGCRIYGNGVHDLLFKGTIGEAYFFIGTYGTYSGGTRVDLFNATKARYGVASLDPKYRNYRYAQEKKHEKDSTYRLPRNASVSSAMRGTRGASAHYRPPLFQDAPRQGSIRQN